MSSNIDFVSPDFEWVSNTLHRMLRPVVACVVAILLAIALHVPMAHAKPHLVIDLSNGRVLAQKDAFHPWHPASLTKLMTAYSAMKAVERGEVLLTSPVRISRAARKQPPSRMGYGLGTTVTLENALKLLLIKSANDISVAIGETISGTSEAFAAQMTADAKALGMTGSRFENPHGLHHPRQVTTARDMAVLVSVLHRQFPRLGTMLASPSLSAPKRNKEGKLIRRTYYSYNLLLERYAGADGFKTGFVCASGYNFIGSATRSGRRIAAIVMGRDGQTSRAVDAAKLITEGFQSPLETGTPLADLKPDSAVPSSPTNMRSTLCTPEARAARYEPGAGAAVIDSPWLQDRKITQQPLRVVLGGTSGPSKAPDPRARRIPVPTFRPDGRDASDQSKRPNTALALLRPSAGNASVQAPIEPLDAARTGLPVPTFRPAILQN